jgi:nicotinamidase-related amidase
MSDGKRDVLTLPVRYYQMWPAISPGGQVQRTLDLPVAQTCFMELRCWNLGYPDGPAMPVDRFYAYGGAPQGGQDGSDALVRDIIDNYIAPAMTAARSAGLPVFHVQPRLVGDKYPQSRFMLEPDEYEAPALPEAVPGWRHEREEKVHGLGFREWAGWNELDAAPPVRPREGDYVVITGPQFDRILRHLGVVNLVYTGFYTYSSLLYSAGGIHEMMAHYGYRPILLRECTLAEECPDTLPQRLMTRVGYRFIEQQCGYTARAEDFLAACRAVNQATQSSEPFAQTARGQ